MPKKSKINISGIQVLRTIIFLLIGFILFTVYVQLKSFLLTSPLFEVKEVMLDRSIAFIDQRGLKDLKGVNIFKIDIAKLHHQLELQYPYIANLRIIRQLPDRILILAKKREPLFQLDYQGKYLVIDTEGIALYFTLQPSALPQVFGAIIQHQNLFLGRHLNSPQMLKVVEILNLFKESPLLEQWRVHAVQAANLTKIDISVGENMHVILDDENTSAKMGVLQMLVGSNKIDLNKVRYIDLRFKEPVIANNDEDSSKE